MAALAGRVDYETVDLSEEICDMTNDAHLLNSIKIYNRNRPTCVHSHIMSQLEVKNNIGDPNYFSMKDEQDAEINELLNLMCKVQTRYSDYSSEDRLLASEDMQRIFEIQREYETHEISLNIAISIWIERLQESGQIISYRLGGTPYTDERAKIINALLDIDDTANNLE